MFEKVKIWARKLKLELSAVFIAAKDNRTPRRAKYLAIAVAAYALSPIDLIPDFIPVLGYLDDLIIVPIGIAIIVRMIPAELMNIFRSDAKNLAIPKANWIVGCLVLVIWVLLAVLLVDIFVA